MTTLTALPDAIERDRAVALALLKPSKRDLDYGLALHRECLVAESYSLGLHAPVDAEALDREAASGASASEWSDLFEDHLMLNWTSTPELLAQYRQAWETSGVGCLFINAGEEGNRPERLLKRLARYTALIDTLPDLLARATTAEQIRANHRAGKRSLCFALNGVPLPGRCENVQDELREIRTFARLGVRMMHLTYQRRNPIGDGCGEINDGGLSHFGHAVVGELNRLGVVIDLAHTGWKTCLDVAKTTQRPVLVSHSAVHALSGHLRAKPDNVIRAVLDTGGTMGITNYPDFLGLSGDLSALLEHIDYMVRTFGEDSVTIGTDDAYKTTDAAETLETLQWPAARERWEGLWPNETPGSDPRWTSPELHQSMAWTNWPLYTVGMVMRGYRDETIAKILGGNLLRVIAANTER